MSPRALLVACLLTLSTSSFVHADLIAGDTFNDKTLGALNNQGGGLGSWVGNYSAVSGVTVVSGGLSYSAGPVNIQGGSQSVRILNTNGVTDPLDAIVARGFAGQTGPVYFSFLFRPGQSPDPGATNGDFVQFLLNNDTNELVSGSIGMGRTDTNNPFFSRVNQSGTSGDTDNSLVLAQDATTYFLVGRFEKNGSANYNQMSLWVNPTSLTETSPLVTSTYNHATNSTSLLDFFTARSAGITAGESYLFDELRIGNTFDAVVVPEPASWVLGGLALAGGWLVRRRLKYRRLAAPPVR